MVSIFVYNPCSYQTSNSKSLFEQRYSVTNEFHLLRCVIYIFFNILHRFIYFDNMKKS